MQPTSPYAGLEHPSVYAETEHVEESPRKKSVMGKVKDKAKKLRTKIKKPKSPGANEASSSSGEEEESGSDPSPQAGDQSGAERELKGDDVEAVPDPHVSQGPAATAGLEQGLGRMNLRDEPDTRQLQETLPAAPGHVSAGVTPYLASHNVGESPYASEANKAILVEEGKNAEGKDLLVTPTSADPQGTTAMDYETPTSEEKPCKEEQKPVKDRVAEGAAATAGALGVASILDGDSAEKKDATVPAEKRSYLEQAKDRIFGSSKKAEGESLETSGSQPTITERATGLKDTIAATLGYGSNKDLTGGGGDKMSEVAKDPAADKSAMQKAQESAAGTATAVASKLGYGDKPPQEGEEVGTGDNKPYTERAYDTAAGAKDAVAAKLDTGDTGSRDTPIDEATKKSYDAATGVKDAVAAKLGAGDTGTTDTPPAEGEQKSYVQKVQESVLGAKDTVATKFGYANKDLPASTEGAYTDEQNVPASVAERFHPGEEDRALSQLITEKMSTGATSVKDTLLRPFGASKSGPPTPTTTPPPASAHAVAEDPALYTVTDAAPGEEKPGIMSKVTGAVSSLLGTTGSGKKSADEASGKANEDPQAPVETKETH